MKNIIKIVTKVCLYFTIFSIVISCKEKDKKTVSKSQALEIAKRYNIVGDSVEINFETYVYPKTSEAFKKGKRKLLYWEVSKKCNQCGIVQIDAETGKVFLTGKYNYQY